MDPKKIIIVEDDAFLRQIYSDTLTSEGYTVETGVDGEDGFIKIKNNTYDLILVDILMPKLNGFEMLEKLKADPQVKLNTLVVFLTNLDNEDDIKRALAVGNGYLIKSQITPGDLVKEVKMYLGKTPDPTAQHAVN